MWYALVLPRRRHASRRIVCRPGPVGLYSQRIPMNHACRSKTNHMVPTKLNWLCIQDARHIRSIFWNLRSRNTKDVDGCSSTHTPCFAITNIIAKTVLTGGTILINQSGSTEDRSVEPLSTMVFIHVLLWNKVSTLDDLTLHAIHCIDFQSFRWCVPF